MTLPSKTNSTTKGEQTPEIRFSSHIAAPEGVQVEIFGMALPLNTLSRANTEHGLIYERVASGGVSISPDLTLTVQHDRTRALGRLGRQVTLAHGSDGIYLRAALSPTREAEDVRTLIRDGTLTGLSVEMIPLQEEWGEHDGLPLRDIIRAQITRISVVDTPAYKAATVEARQMAEEYTGHDMSHEHDRGLGWLE